ncbi:hypothetical protein HFP72_01935 [Nocardiopsis sp. ARC36]
MPARPTRARRAARLLDRGRPLTYLLLVILAAYALGPIVVMVFSALKTPAELSTNPMGCPPTPPGTTSPPRGRARTWPPAWPTARSSCPAPPSACA